MEFTHQKLSGKRGYSLKIDSKGNLIIKTNKSVSEREVLKIIKKHEDWIQKHKQNISEENKSVEKFKLKLIENEVLEVLGEKFYLKFEESTNLRLKLEFSNNSLVFLSKNIYDLTFEQKNKALIKFLSEIARDYIYSRTRFFSNLYNLNFNNLTTKDQKTRWGSCSSKKNLNYSWRLILCPKEVLDYVVVHEVCHLKEMNHSKRFWDLVLVQCPHYRVYKKWLRENGKVVKAIL